MEWGAPVRSRSFRALAAGLALSSLGASAGGCCFGGVTLGSGGATDAAPTPPTTAAARPARAPARAAEPDDAGLVEARRLLGEEIRRAYPSVSVEHASGGAPLRVPCTVDFAWGDRAAGTLVLSRLVVGPSTVTCERVSWSSGRGDASGAEGPAEPPGRAERADVPVARVRPLLDAVRALAGAAVRESPQPVRYVRHDEFFVLVRVCGDGRDRDGVWEYAGPRSSHREVRFAAPEATVRRAQEVFGHLPWEPVPPGAYRSTHVADAFARNRDIYVRESRRWVLEASVDALGTFGDPSVVPSVQWVDERLWEPSPRETSKIRSVLDAPGTYLAGGPRVIPGE